MRAQNFSWFDSIYLKTGNLELDIHNCYDFRRLTYDVTARTIKLEWKRSTGEWVDQALPGIVEISLTGVDYLRLEPRDPEQPFTEDDCLSSFGYDCDEVWTDGQFWTDEPPESHWRWSFAFQSGAEVVVGGQSASVTLQA